MLVLGRKRREAIELDYLGQKVRLIVVGIRGNKVQLGVEAPPEVRIQREPRTES